MESCHAQSHRLTFSSLNTKTFPHRKGMRANQFASLSRLITAWSLWGMPTKAAKYHICKRVQTIAWRCHKRNPQYQSGKCSNTGAAVSGTFNAVTAWQWNDSDWKGAGVDADGCTACRLHCRISQSVWAANDLKIEGTLPKAKAFRRRLVFSCFIWDNQDMRAHPAQLSTRMHAQAIYRTVRGSSASSPTPAKNSSH